MIPPQDQGSGGGSGMPALPNMNESAPTYFSGAPADRPRLSLGELLQMAAAMIGEDGMISPDEQAALAAFQQRILLIMQRMKAMGGGAQPGGPSATPSYQGPGDVGPAGSGAGLGPAGSPPGQDSSTGSYQ